jgi:hypothetical protein
MLGYGLKYPTQFKDTHLNPTRHTTTFESPSRIDGIPHELRRM